MILYQATKCHASLSLSVLTAIFQVNLGQPVFIEAKDDGGGGDNWSTGAISLAKLQSNHHHQQTNIQLFTGRMPSLSPNQQCQRTEGKSTEGFLCSTEEKCDTPIGSMQTDPVNLNCTK